MKYLSYKKNIIEELFIENVAISDAAKAINTPFYAYSKKMIEENFAEFYENFKDVDHKICYAIKANSNINIVKIFAGLGSGIDAVSQGEIFRAIEAGINPKKIVFAGLAKTKDEIFYALTNGVEEFSVESEGELYALNEVATRLGKKAKFSLRVNPNVDAKTLDKISTGKKGDKFGVDIEIAPEIYKKASMLPGIEIYGIATHIGSQINSIEPFKKAFNKIRDLFIQLKLMQINVRSLDFGGGIGIGYNDETLIKISDYAKMIKEIIKDLDIKLTLAPGRAMIGNAGILVSKIIYLKKTDHKNFAIIDAAMNDLMRPGLYDSYHAILQNEIKIGAKEIFDIVGGVCESTDILAKNRELILPKQDDLIIFLSAGAYGSSMSNEYNSRPLIPEILIDGGGFKIIRRRPNYEEMIKYEKNL